MIKTLFSLSVSGEEFSPKRAETELGLSFAYKRERGEKSERYGVVSGLGLAMFIGIRDINEILEIAERNIANLKRLGASEFDLALEVLHDGQCNFEIDQRSLLRIGHLGLGLAISTYFDEDVSANPTG